jgi:SEC-C motif-containing protein
MKLGRNQLCPCGSGLKFKKCCLAMESTVATPPFVVNDPGIAIPPAIIDEVVNTIYSLPDNDLVDRLDALAQSQPNLCAFITPLSSSLPPAASFQAALSAFAIIWMFQQFQQRPLPKVGVAAIKRCLDRNAKSFFDLDDVYNHTTMAGKHQPALHKFIADTIFDFNEGDLDGFALFTLFMILKTTIDVLHDTTSKLAMADSRLLQPAAVL